MEVLVTIIEFLAVLAVVVLVHEFGHFATAKAFGIKVNEFGFGFPPRLLGIRKRETVYTVNLLPLGGFVKLEGENDPSQPRSFASKGTGTRFIVLAAGAFMNLVLAIFLFAALFMFTIDDQVRVRVGEVAPGSPAELAGVLRGDFILEANGHRVSGFDELADQISANLGKEMVWLIQRKGDERQVRVVPRVEPPAGEGATGINLQFLSVQRWTPTRPPWEALSLAVQHTWNLLVATKDVVVDWVSEGGEAPFAGPIGIAQGTGEVARELGLVSLIPLAGFLSLMLGITNILPIPALDGGRILFVVVEWLRRGKRIPPEKEGLIHLVGFVIILAMVLGPLTYKDISRIVEGGSLLR